MPIVYGIIMFIGLAYTWHKLLHGKIVSVGIDMAVFWLVFSLHGHSMTGGFAAMIAAAMSSLFFPHDGSEGFQMTES
jgi:heme/copper-type cytochrome/quinol oxidase subunit 3